MVVWPIDFSISDMYIVVQSDAVKGSRRALAWVGNIQSVCAIWMNTKLKREREKWDFKRIKNLISMSLRLCFSKTASSACMRYQTSYSEITGFRDRGLKNRQNYYQLQQCEHSFKSISFTPNA